MKKKNITIALLSLIALAFVLLFWRGCRNKPTANDQQPTTKIDTITTHKPDTGWHVPELPEAQPPKGGAFQAEADHYRKRYEHYKREAVRRAGELAALSALLDSLGDGCPEASALAKELAMYREQYSADSAYIAELSQVATLRNYAGRDSTADWVHHYDITVLGEMPKGGYKYKTDFVQRTIERTVTLPAPKVRRNALLGMVGFTTDDLRLTNGVPSYALQYQLQGRRLVAVWQVGYPAEAMVGVGWRW